MAKKKSTPRKKKRPLTKKKVQARTSPKPRRVAQRFGAADVPKTNSPV